MTMYGNSDVMVHSALQCIPHVDSEVLAALVPRIVEILKSGVGLGTKVCLSVCLSVCPSIHLFVLFLV